MMLKIDNVMTADQLREIRGVVDGGQWVDGNETSGHQSRLAKKNEQLAQGSDAALNGIVQSKGPRGIADDFEDICSPCQHNANASQHPIGHALGHSTFGHFGNQAT